MEIGSPRLLDFLVEKDKLAGKLLDTTAGQYKVIKPLGIGAFGEVWLVEDLQNQQLVALKQLKLNSVHPEQLTSLKTEFALLAELHHPHLAKVFHFGHAIKDEFHFFTEEYCEGEPLFEACEGESIKFIEACFIQLLTALATIHQQNIIHLDLKNQNFIVKKINGKPHLKLLDFGLATKLAQLSTNKLGGTPAYMSPEVIARSNYIDRRTDLYAVGILLYHVLTKEWPFPTIKAHEVIQWHRKGSLTSEWFKKTQAPSYMKEMVEKLLQKNPQERYSQANTVLQAFDLATQQRYPIENLPLYKLSDGPLLERETLQQSLREDFKQTVELAKPRSWYLWGDSGLGKTRLLEETIKEFELLEIPLFHFNKQNSHYELKRFMNWLDYQDYESISKHHFLELIKKKSPVIIFSDDHHDLDHDTINWLNYLTQQITVHHELNQPFGVMLVTTGHTNKSGYLHKRELAALSQDTVQSYIQEVMGQPDEKLTSTLMKYSAGIPATMILVLKQLLPDYLKTRKITPEKINLNINSTQLTSLNETENLIIFYLNLLPLTITNLSDLLDQPEEEIIYMICQLKKNTLLKRIHDDNWKSIYYWKDENFSHCFHKETIKKHYRHLADYLVKINFKSLEKIAAFYQQAQQKKSAFHYYKQAGIYFKKAGLYHRSLTCYQESIQLSSSKKQTLPLLREWLRLSLNLGELKSIQEQLTELNSYQDFIIYELLAWYFWKRNELSKAEQYFENSIQLIKKEDIYRKIRIHNAIGELKLSQGDYLASETLFKNSLKQENDLKTSEVKKTLNNQLGLVYALQGKVKLALDFYQTRLNQGLSNEDRLTTYSAIGFITMQQGKLLDAIHAYREILKIIKTGTHYPNLHEVYSNLASALLQTGRYAEAIEIEKTNEQWLLSQASYLNLSWHKLREVSLMTNLGQWERANYELKLGKKLAKRSKAQELLEWFDLFECFIFKESGKLNLAKKHFLTLNKSVTTSVQQWIYLGLAEIAVLDNETKSLKNWIDKFNYPSQDIELKIRQQLCKLKHKTDQKDLNQLIELCKQSDRRELLTEVYWQQTQYHQQNKQYQKAQLTLANAKKILTKITNELPEAFQDRYQRTHFRVQIFHPKSTEAHKMEPSMLLKIMEINKQLISQHQPESLLEIIMDHALEFSQAEEGFLLILNKHEEFEVKVARNLNQQDAQLVEFSKSIANRVIELGKPIYSIDAMEDGELNAFESVVQMNLKTVACAPLTLHNKIIGVIYLASRQRQTGLNEQFLTYLNLFAEQAAMALKNAHSFHEKEKQKLALKENLNEVHSQLHQKEEEIAELTRMVGQKQKRQHDYSQIIGQAPKMQPVFHLMDKVRDAKVSVYIHGETGTGKELVAKALHEQSKRTHKPFIAINCSSFSESLLESELFGHVKGSFTGADRDKKGLFELAHAGTLFLDEVADMNLTMQAKLLRVIQEQEVRKVGGNQNIKIDVRVICAANRKLPTLVKAGKFREDLYYRLAGITINLPPLRERKEDLPLLIHHFIQKISQENALQGKISLTKAALQKLLSYQWPGNIRELEQCLTSACLLCEKNKIEPDQLLLTSELYQNSPEPSSTREELPSSKIATISFNPDKKLSGYEEEIIMKTLQHYDGNKSATAKHLGISRLTLHKKLTQYQT